MTRRICKLIIGLTLFAAFQTTSALAQHYSKLSEKITIHLVHTDADAVIRALKEHSTYNFVYDPSELKNIPIDELNFNGAPLGALLEYLHRTIGLSFSVNNKTISVQKGPKPAEHRTSEINGKVIEASTGNALTGATIRTASGATSLTDEKGEFHLTLLTEDDLAVSYTGFKTKAVRPTGPSAMLISLDHADSSLSEVVVVGYGTQLKQKITGSIATIGDADLQQTQTPTFTDAMVGRLPGVQISTITGVPGSMPSIRVRGTGSITAGNEPLYVVDGFPLGEETLSDFNVADIESVSVLKDASATAIYGSRGANGVVIVTTKRGRKGKAKVSYNSWVGEQEITKKIDLLKPEEFVQYAIDARNNAWTYLGHSASDPNSVRSPLYQISPYFSDQKDWVTTDWQNQVFRKAPVTDHQLSVSGGSDAFRYLLSGSWFQQDGIIKNSSFTRYSLRGNIDAQPTSWLHLSGTFFTSIVNNKLADDQGQFANGVLGTLINSAPIYGLKNADGSYPSTVGFGYGVSEVPNPMVFINEDHNTSDQHRTSANFTATVDILHGLAFKSMIGFDYASIDSNDFFNSYTDDLPANPGQVREVIPAVGSYSSQSDFNWLSENTLNYTFNRGGDHSFEALAGFTAQKATSENVNISAVNFPNNLVSTLNAGQISSAATFKSEWSLLSYLARINYAYKNRYFATATIRQDGSSRFGSDNRWGTFPSISAGWMVSNESFFNVPWINSLKVRGSYGLAGNNDISNYGAIGLLAYSNYIIGNTRVSGISPSTLTNAALSWEKSQQTDIGLETGLFRDRINLVADIYQRTSNDLLLDVPVPSILGLTNSLENIGKVRNRGLELGLNTRNFVGKFKWSTDINFSMNRNKVLALGADGAPIISSTQGDSHITQVGKPIGNFYGYIFDGVYNTQDQINKHAHQSTDGPGDPIVRDIDGDGQISTNDRTILGNYQPSYTYGIGNNFSYSNFDLTVNMQGVEGSKIMDLGMRQSLDMNGRTNQLGLARDRWRSPQEPGNGKVFKAMTDIYGVRRDASSFYMQDGSYLRVRNIILGYNFSPSLLSRLKVSTLRIYVSAQNPFTITKYIGYNPEVSSYHSALTPGVDYFNYPLAKTFSAGLNLTF
jgi:TonB-linked SusC/RagA family outer membrane protein